MLFALYTTQILLIADIEVPSLLIGRYIAKSFCTTDSSRSSKYLASDNSRVLYLDHCPSPKRLLVIRDMSHLILRLSLTRSNFVGFKDLLAKAAFRSASQGMNSAAADSHRKWEMLAGVWKRPGRKFFRRKDSNTRFVLRGALTRKSVHVSQSHANGRTGGQER